MTQAGAAKIIFWSFQAINGLSALGLFVAPRASHEATFKNPQQVYQQLGFSATAQEMLHNVLRGQGAVLLSVSTFLAYLGQRNRSSYLLIGNVCGFAVLAHLLTARHHLRNPSVMAALHTHIAPPPTATFSATIPYSEEMSPPNV